MAPGESHAAETNTSFEGVRKRLGTEPGTFAEFEAQSRLQTEIKVYAVGNPPR